MKRFIFLMLIAMTMVWASPASYAESDDDGGGREEGKRERKEGKKGKGGMKDLG